MKRIIVLTFVSMLVMASAAAQAMTRIAVIDLVKIYDVYSKDSVPIRSYEEDRMKAQGEIDRLQAEVKELERKKADAILAGKQDIVTALEKEIPLKNKNLKEFIRIKLMELDEKKRKLMDASEFARAIYKSIQYISEIEGFSIVLTTRSADTVNSSIVWYNPVIDITEKVILNLVPPRP